MSDNTNNINTGTRKGVSFSGLLTIAFIVLKLCNVINWSWIWVLSPIWISFALYVALLITIVFVSLIIAGIKAIIH